MLTCTLPITTGDTAMPNHDRAATRSGRTPSAPAETWTPEIVQGRIREALGTLHRLPMNLNARDFPELPRLASLERNYRPEYDAVFAALVHEVAEHGHVLAPRVRPSPPSPQSIDRMDEALCWLLWLNATQRRVVWSKAFARHGDTMRLARRYRCNRTTINRWHQQSIRLIVRRLNAENTPVRAAPEAA